MDARKNAIIAFQFVKAILQTITHLIRLWSNCFNDISVNANPMSVRLKSKRQRINTGTFYFHDT